MPMHCKSSIAATHENVRSVARSMRILAFAAMVLLFANEPVLAIRTSDPEEKLQATAQSQRPGAREPHTFDIYDVDRGALQRTFGRVSYLEGQELTFYAYHLSDLGPHSSGAQFYVWGNSSTGEGQVVQLGILRKDSDDEGQWVLKSGDAAVLARIDSLFVTVESNEHAEKPHGKHMLYALLAGRPNRN